MIVKFNSAIENMLACINNLLQQNQNTTIETTVDEGDYESPNASLSDVNFQTSSCRKKFKELLTTLEDRKLVILVDDCQLFFKGVIPSVYNDDTIPASEIMSLALRCFSKCITPYTNHKNIVWVFVGIPKS